MEGETPWVKAPPLCGTGTRAQTLLPGTHADGSTGHLPQFLRICRQLLPGGRPGRRLAGASCSGAQGLQQRGTLGPRACLAGPASRALPRLQGLTPPPAPPPGPGQAPAPPPGPGPAQARRPYLALQDTSSRHPALHRPAIGGQESHGPSPTGPRPANQGPG